MAGCCPLWEKCFFIFIFTCGTQSYNIKLGYADYDEWLPYYASAINMALEDVQNQTNWLRDTKVRLVHFNVMGIYLCSRTFLDDSLGRV